jgi:hypothetical protein
MSAKKANKALAKPSGKPQWLTNFQSGAANRLEEQRAKNEAAIMAQGFTNKQELGNGMTQYTRPPSSGMDAPSGAVDSSFQKIMGGNRPSLKSLDDLFEYEGVKYGDLPSYKAGSGGGKSLDRLASMMGGQIYNPYQFSRMKSAGGASGEYPYKSALSGQEASAAMAKQKMAGEQSMREARLGAETNRQMQAINLGYASVAEMEADLRRKRIASLLST